MSTRGKVLREDNDITQELMGISESNYFTRPYLRGSLGGCRFSSVLLSWRLGCDVLAWAFAVLMLVDLTVIIGVTVAVNGVLVVVIIAVGTRPVGFAVPREADPLLDLVEVVARSHGVL